MPSQIVGLVMAGDQLLASVWIVPADEHYEWATIVVEVSQQLRLSRERAIEFDRLLSRLIDVLVE